MKKGQRGEIMGITHSILIVIAIIALVFLIQKTEHKFLYSMIILYGYGFILYKYIPLMKIANMEHSGMILVIGFFIMGLLNMYLSRKESKR